MHRLRPGGGAGRPEVGAAAQHVRWQAIASRSRGSWLATSAHVGQAIEPSSIAPLRGAHLRLSISRPGCRPAELRWRCLLCSSSPWGVERPREFPLQGAFLRAGRWLVISAIFSRSVNGSCLRAGISTASHGGENPISRAVQPRFWAAIVARSEAPRDFECLWLRGRAGFKLWGWSAEPTGPHSWEPGRLCDGRRSIHQVKSTRSNPGQRGRLMSDLEERTLRVGGPIAVRPRVGRRSWV